MFKFHPDFTHDVLCHSDTAKRRGLNNNCPEAFLENLLKLSNALGEVQAHLKYLPLTITSGFRCEALNEAVGGVKGSQHTFGMAADFTCPAFGSAYQVAQTLAISPIVFDQLILEFNRWVHLSIAPASQPSRRECLSIFNQEEGYLEGIIER
jgi:zinc D-Ala-D-Ala carboxypeptidase